MFFLIRSAFCIGVIAWMAGVGSGGLSSDRLASWERSASADAGQRCLRNTECVSAGLHLATWFAGHDSTAAATSISPAGTLQPSDLLPMWRGPSPGTKG